MIAGHLWKSDGGRSREARASISLKGENVMLEKEGGMPRRKDRRTMTEIVAEAKSSTSQPRSRRLPPGIHGGQLIGRDGTAYKPVSSNVEPTEASRLVRDGAAVTFDECACGGTCGLVWASEEDRASLANSHPVLGSHKGLDGVISLWESVTGERVMLAQGPVTWA